MSEQETNYLLEMVTHPLQVAGASASVIAASGLLAILGPLPAALPLLGYAAVAGVAGVLVPTSPAFRARVDRQKRAERRESSRRQLQNQIEWKRPRSQEKNPRFPALPDADLTWTRTYQDLRDRYQQMRVRLRALAKLAKRARTRLASHDIERLDDATIDYLRLFYARLNIRERIQADTGEVGAQLEQIEHELRSADLTAVDRRRLEQAQATLQRVARQRSRLPGREAAIAAQLISMSEAFEEIYHRVNTDPTSGSVTDYLQEATERLTIEDELADGLELELEEAADKAKRRKQRQQRTLG